MMSGEPISAELRFDQAAWDAVFDTPFEQTYRVVVHGRRRIPLLTGRKPASVSRAAWARNIRVARALRRRERRHGIPAAWLPVTTFIPHATIESSLTVVGCNTVIAVHASLDGREQAEAQR